MRQHNWVVTLGYAPRRCSQCLMEEVKGEPETACTGKHTLDETHFYLRVGKQPFAEVTEAEFRKVLGRAEGPIYCSGVGSGDLDAYMFGKNPCPPPPVDMNKIPPGWEYHNGALCDPKVSREMRESWYRECQESAELNRGF